jgi:hypothetical protein
MPPRRLRLDNAQRARETATLDGAVGPWPVAARPNARLVAPGSPPVVPSASVAWRCACAGGREQERRDRRFNGYGAWPPMVSSPNRPGARPSAPSVNRVSRPLGSAGSPHRLEVVHPISRQLGITAHRISRSGCPPLISGAIVHQSQGRPQAGGRDLRVAGVRARHRDGPPGEGVACYEAPPPGWRLD